MPSCSLPPLEADWGRLVVEEVAAAALSVSGVGVGAEAGAGAGAGSGVSESGDAKTPFLL